MSDGDWVCLQLPRRGNNWLVMQRRAEAHPNRHLYMFPDAATGWDVYFISFGECQIVQMQEFDILKLCPQDNWWPYCSYCGKFVLPSLTVHRASRQHEKMRMWLLTGGGEWQERSVIDQCVYYTGGLAWPRGPC